MSLAVQLGLTKLFEVIYGIIQPNVQLLTEY